MSSGCGDVLSLADLQTAKKHQIFEAEVITGKSGGVAGGADIDYATNAVTGQTQKTLPAVLRDAGFSPVSWDFSTGGTLNDGDRGKVVYDHVSKTWYSYAGVFPVTVPAGFNPVGNADWMPQTDPSLSDRVDSLSDRVDTLEGEISVLADKTTDWVTPDKFKLPGAVDDTAAFTAALAVSKRIKLMARTYYVNADTIATSSDDVYIIGEGSSYSKLVANSSGSYLFKQGGGTNVNTVRERISIKGITFDGAGLVTNTVITCASQSPDFIEDVVVTGATSHGMVHTRGWSTFARGLVCTNNGGQGLRLEGDNNNTHWEGMWSHNGAVGIYIRNAADVTVKGSIENNGEHGAWVTATSTIASGFVNTISSVVCFDGVYFESNGQNTAGTYAEIQFGGNDGTVRDCSVSNSHIGVPLSGIGLQISQQVSGLKLDTVGFYQVGGPATAHIRYSGAYTSISSVIATNSVFNNINASSSLIVAQGFTDENLDLPAYVLGGGTVGKSGVNFQAKNIRLTDANVTGTYLERIYRGTELISERGVKPNVQVWSNAASSDGYHSYAIAGTEVFRINKNNIQPRTDNKVNLGAASTRWGTVYAGNGTINTSDERLKITVHSDKYTLNNEALAAAEIKKSIYRFKFTDSITDKGEQCARIHFGVGAQTVHDILIKYGLKPSDYAFWCYDEWGDEFDGDGNIIIHAGNRYGIRYDELCMFILKYI